LALVEALLLASLELLLLRLLLLLLLVGKEVPKAKTIEKWQSESAMNSCKGVTDSLFLNSLVLFLHKNMRFERTLFSLHDGFVTAFYCHLFFRIFGNTHTHYKNFQCFVQVKACD
jgi:hypothetical protein